MKILNWNLNQRSSDCIKSLPPFVVKEIMQQKADIIVLTELGVLKDFKETVLYKTLSKKYFIETNSEKNMDGNKILIGVSKKIVNNYSGNFLFIDDEFINTPNNEVYPNYLHVDLSLRNITLHIIGVRIRIGNGEREDYLCRKVQLKNLLSHIENQQLENVVIVGDFNNSRIMGDISKTYNDVRHLYRYDRQGNESVLYDTYNYHILKDKFANESFKVSTPNKDSQYSFFIDNFGYKLDHIFSKGLIITEPTYSWDFTHCNHDCNCDKKPYHINYSPVPPYPDHAMLIANIITTIYTCPKCGNNIIELGEYSIPPSCDECQD